MELIKSLFYMVLTSMFVFNIFYPKNIEMQYFAIGYGAAVGLILFLFDKPSLESKKELNTIPKIELD